MTVARCVCATQSYEVCPAPEGCHDHDDRLEWNVISAQEWSTEQKAAAHVRRDLETVLRELPYIQTLPPVPAQDKWGDFVPEHDYLVKIVSWLGDYMALQKRNAQVHQQVRRERDRLSETQAAVREFFGTA